MTGILLTVFFSLVLTVASDTKPSPLVRLVGAKNMTGKPWQGRVEVYHNGQWGTVCDDVWEMNAVNVLCRELGFARARLPFCCARFGQGNETQPIFLAEVHCQGNEKSILDCRNTGWGPHPNCQHGEDAGVACLKTPQFATDGNCNFDESNCGYTQDINDDFDWTLRSGRTQSWATGPQNDHTQNTNAGYYMYIETSRPGKYEDFARLISPTITGKNCLQFYYYMYGVHVNELRVYVDKDGKAETLVWHLHGNQGRGWKGARFALDGKPVRIVFEGLVGSGYQGDIAIDDIVVLSNSNNCSTVVPAIAKPVIDTSTIDIRLVGGKTSNVGRVEVQHTTGKGEKTWGTICGDWDWGIEDAKVVCKSLGFPGAEMALKNAVFGEGTGKVWLANLHCTGKEGSISTCAHRGWGQTSCNHNQDASVICQTNNSSLTDFELRLNGTKSSDYEGRVELLYGGLWGTINSQQWDIEDGNVACRQLQHSGAYEVYHSSNVYGRGKGPQWVSNFLCFGNESRLSKCNHTVTTYHSWWSHFRDAGVKCYDLRLVGGKTKMEGRVEVMYEGVWGTICSRDWDIRDANVVCRELGYTRAIDNATSKTFGPGSGKILLDGLRCTGQENTLSSCSSRGWGMSRPDCTHALDVGVTCEIVKVPPGCEKKKCQSPSFCQVRAKVSYCLCRNNTGSANCDLPVGKSVVSIALTETPQQWNQDSFNQDLVEGLNGYCSKSKSKCGFDSTSKKLSNVDVVFTKDPNWYGDQLLLEMVVFVPGSKTPLTKDVLSSAIRNKRSLDGHDIVLVAGKPLASTISKHHGASRVAVGVGVALAVIAVFGLVLFVGYMVKRRIVQGKLRSVGGGGGGRGGSDQAYSQLAVDDDDNFDPDAPLLIPPTDNVPTDQLT